MRRVLNLAMLLGLALSHAMAESLSPAANVVDPKCQTLETAALVNDLPLEFLTRLIWQESRFDAFAVSRAGAQGIAQFMPATAVGVKLANPFDPIAAIDKSAELLRDLRAQFGNLGLAAAAYNAGPKRVADWLVGRRRLPEETVRYVRIITGHSPDAWRDLQFKPTNLSLPVAIPCPEIMKLLSAHSTTAGQQPANPTNPATPAAPGWAVQLIGDNSQATALLAFYKLQRTYWAILGSHRPLVLRSSVGRNAYWYRVRIGADSRADAEQLCSSLRGHGGSCLVQLN